MLGPLEAGGLEEVGASSEGDPLEVFAPEELEEDPVGGLVGDALSFVSLDLCPGVSWGEGACGEPGGELGGVGFSDEAVAGLVVGFNVS